MSARTIIVVVLALVCGLCAAVGIQSMKRAPKAVAEAVPEPIAKEPVVAVLAPIAQGQIIQAADIAMEELPKAFVPPGALKLTADAVGHRAQIALVKGDTLTDRMLMQEKISNLGPRIQPGWRAFTIMSSGPSSSLAGALETGDRVDVLFTRASQGGPGGSMVGSRATILLQDIEVLAVNPKDENALANKLAPHEVTSATLHVSLQDASILDQAQATGAIHLALRGSKPGDEEGTHDRAPVNGGIPLAWGGPGNQPPFGGFPVARGGPRNQAPLPQAGDLAKQLPPGKRAFTIETRSLTSTVAGFLLPGGFVDVLHTPKDAKSPTPGETLDKMLAGGKAQAEPRNKGGGRTKTILKGVQILAVHTRRDAPQNSQFDPSEVLSVTLLVDPDEAERLDQGQNSGVLSLSLRSSNEPDATLAAPPAIAPKCLLADIPAGMRLFKLRIAEPLLLPNGSDPKDMRVDVLLAFKTEEGKAHGLGGAVTTTLVQDVPIVDSNEIDGDSPDDKPTYEISLALTPEDVVLARLGQDVGTLQLSLRGQNNAGMVNPPRAHPNLNPFPQAVMHFTRTRTITLRGTRVGRDVETLIGPLILPRGE